MRTRKIANHNNKTLKLRNLLSGRIIEKKEGWIILQINGEPYDRGFAHGFLLKNELKHTMKVLQFLLKQELRVSMQKFMETSNKIMKPIVQKYYPEFYEEMRGISAGARKAGLSISTDLIIAWNSYISLYSYFLDGSIIKCSAFIATGKATEKGDIVMAHNTHTNFADGQLHNVIIYVTPTNGHPFVMQTSPGFIASSTDWFLCSTGIIGCETTISAINYKPKFGDPYYCRIRQAMQYGETLDDYDKIMSTRNAGDYACSWLFGDIRTNEIMLYEIGLKKKNIERTKNGVFYGMNSAMDDKIRKDETTDIDHDNITTSVGARNARLDQLLNHDLFGKLNLDNAKDVMADHYDIHLRRTELNGRGICNHSELDEEYCGGYPHYPFGCTDAKVVNTEMAKQLSFIGRFGSACGRTFSVKKYAKENPAYKHWASVLHDIPKYDWINIIQK